MALEPAVTGRGVGCVVIICPPPRVAPLYPQIAPKNTRHSDAPCLLARSFLAQVVRVRSAKARRDREPPKRPGPPRRDDNKKN